MKLTKIAAGNQTISSIELDNIIVLLTKVKPDGRIGTIFDFVISELKDMSSEAFRAEEQAEEQKYQDEKQEKVNYLLIHGDFPMAEIMEKTTSKGNRDIEEIMGYCEDVGLADSINYPNEYESVKVEFERLIAEGV